jgi:poly-gamma-glutamate capsule biosynthesis protein CapA/YwtB (metallophosphatase superfamily)
MNCKQPNSFSASGTSKQEIHIFAVGDIMLADAAQAYLDRHGYNYPFRQIKPYFQDADLIVGNLEVPLTCHTVPLSPEKKYAYKASPESAQALKDFGFDLLCLANNHILDYGVTGLLDTQKILDKYEIGYFGAGTSYQEAIAGHVVEIAGNRIGFVGFMQGYRAYRENYKGYFALGDNPGVAQMTQQTVQEAIAALRPCVDVLIVSFHWGRNYMPVTETQKQWGKRTVKYNVDLVLGHHPHIAQGVEIYQNVPIVYSLGNFTFGARGRFHKVDKIWHHGWIADITIYQKQVIRLDLIPIKVDNQVIKFQPQVAEPEILPQLLMSLNDEFETEMEIVHDRARLNLA